MWNPLPETLKRSRSQARRRREQYCEQSGLRVYAKALRKAVLKHLSSGDSGPENWAGKQGQITWGLVGLLGLYPKTSEELLKGFKWKWGIFKCSDFKSLAAV